MNVDNVRLALSRKAPNLSDLISDEQIAQVLTAEKTYRAHPVRDLFLAVRGWSMSEQVLWNTDQALRCLRSVGNENLLDAWTRERMRCATKVDDFKNAAAALGEIRAGGALMQAGFDVIPKKEGPTATCDFLVQRGKSEAYVEVATKLMNQKQAVAIEAGERDVGGSPNKEQGETVGENVGHKFASIKPKAKQSVPGAVSLLWVDAQDEDWWPANELHAKPVVSWQGEFTSGGIWHAFYGQKCIPTFEGQSVEKRASSVRYYQTYPGLFCQTKRWSAVLLSFRRSTVVFEHPDPDVRIPSTLAEHLLDLPWLRYENCWMNWPSRYPRSLNARIKRTIKEPSALASKARFTW